MSPIESNNWGRAQLASLWTFMFAVDALSTTLFGGRMWGQEGVERDAFLAFGLVYLIGGVLFVAIADLFRSRWHRLPGAIAAGMTLAFVYGFSTLLAERGPIALGWKGLLVGLIPAVFAGGPIGAIWCILWRRRAQAASAGRGAT